MLKVCSDIYCVGNLIQLLAVKAIDRKSAKTRVTSCPGMHGTVSESRVCPASRAEAIRDN